MGIMLFLFPTTAQVFLADSYSLPRSFLLFLLLQYFLMLGYHIKAWTNVLNSYRIYVYISRPVATFQPMRVVATLLLADVNLTES